MSTRFGHRPSLKKLTEYYSKLETRELAAQLFSFSALLTSGIFDANFQTPDAWSDIVIPSAAGEQMLSYAPPEKFRSADLHLSLFLMFHHHELLIDERRTDPVKIRGLVESDLMKMQIRWPYQWGRLLYDKYNDADDSRAVHELAAAPAASLLADTPQGIYQIGRVLTGPLGILESDERRSLPYPREVCLWHCSDTGCHAPHNVRLLQARLPFLSAASEMRSVANNRLGKQQQWPMIFEEISLGAVPNLNLEPRKYYNLPSIVAECVIENELKSFLELALSQSTSERLRKTLRLHDKKNLSAASPKEIVGGLSTAEQIQLLLVLTDSNLVRLLDRAVRSDKIRVAQSEVRTAKLEQYKIRQEDMPVEMSNLGVRSTIEPPLTSLASQIVQVYSDLKYGDELDWRVRKDRSVSRDYALALYLRENGPEKAVKELVLCSQQVTKAFCDALLLPLPDFAGNDETIRKILWKLGFNLPRLNSYQLLSERLDAFKSTLLRIGDVQTEGQRALIRESGVNLFVSIESLLDELVSYPVWFLSSDHFVTTRCNFDLVAARERVSEVLGQTAYTEGATFSWGTGGENALGTLLHYLSLASDWMRGLSSQDPKPCERSKDDFPHYAEFYPNKFAFRHTQLWADADRSELEQLAQAYAEIVRLIAQSDLATIRNAIDHWRDGGGFPAMERMFTFVARFGEAFRLASEKRYLPKWHWLEEVRSDRFGGNVYELRDYAGSKLIMYGPPHVLGIPTADFKSPVLIAPGNALGYPNSELVFRVRESSPYSEYWSGYPRRDEDESESDPADPE